MPIDVFSVKQFDGVYDNQKIEEMRRLAKLHGGKCLSDVYIDSQTKLRWKCSEGHEWRAKPNKIQQGQWCKKCSYIKRRKSNPLRGNIEDIHRIAKEKGGVCLSDDYVNNHTKLSFRCSKGHEWSTIPSCVNYRHLKMVASELSH